jgi:hypothetical protein
MENQSKCESARAAAIMTSLFCYIRRTMMMIFHYLFCVAAVAVAAAASSIFDFFLYEMKLYFSFFYQLEGKSN